MTKMSAFRLTSLVVSAGLLAGCQSFALTSWMFKKGPDAQHATPRLAGDTSGALAEGAVYLKAGQLSAAVASYRIALLDDASRAEANNGLAVAYARMGREDLADRYFRAAMATDPENPRFAANLLRLQRQVDLARNRDLYTGVGATADIPGMQMATPDPVSTSLQNGMVEHVSRGEVHLHTRMDGRQAPRMIVVAPDGTPRPPSAEPRSGPAPQEYPIRIGLKE